MTTNRSKDSPGAKVQSNNSQKTTQPKQKARSRWQTLRSEGERRGQTPRRCAHARFAARRALGTSLPYIFPKAPRILAKGWGAVATNHHGASESSGSRCCAAFRGGGAAPAFHGGPKLPRRGFSEIKPNSSSECRTSVGDYRRGTRAMARRRCVLILFNKSSMGKDFPAFVSTLRCVPHTG